MVTTSADPDLSPGRLIVFLLTLPRAAAIEPDTVFREVFDVEMSKWLGGRMAPSPWHKTIPPEQQGKLFVSIRFWPASRPSVADSAMLEVPMQILDAIVPRKGRRLRSGRAHVKRWWWERIGRRRVSEEPGTVAEVVTVLEDGDYPAVAAFERCVAGLIDVVRAYRLAARDPIPLPTRERLPMLVPYLTRRVTPPLDWQGPALLHLHDDLPIQPFSRDPNENLMTKMEAAFRAVKSDSPLVAYSEHELEANRAHLIDGDFARAVIHVQVAIESFFDNLLILMLWEEDAPPARVAKEEFGSRRLWQRVQRNFPRRLGGDWNPRGKGPIGRWKNEVAPIRNRVIHQAYLPTYEEAQTCRVVANAVTRFVMERLTLDRNHRRTALLTLGLPGFERYGRMTEELENLAIEFEDGSWFESYRDWRKAFDAALGIQA